MGPAKLQFPCHLYYLSPGKLSKYSLASKKSGCFVELPPADKSGQPHQARHLVHSAKQHAWLVFFQSQSGAGLGSRVRSSRTGTAAGAAAGVSGTDDDEGWHFTLVTDAVDNRASAAGQATWFLPGEVAE